MIHNIMHGKVQVNQSLSPILSSNELSKHSSKQFSGMSIKPFSGVEEDDEQII